MKMEKRDRELTSQIGKFCSIHSKKKNKNYLQDSLADHTESANVQNNTQQNGTVVQPLALPVSTCEGFAEGASYRRLNQRSEKWHWSRNEAIVEILHSAACFTPRGTSSVTTAVVFALTPEY